MTPEQKQQILQLRGNFLHEQEHHQAQWRLLCQCMKQVLHVAQVYAQECEHCLLWQQPFLHVMADVCPPALHPIRDNL